MRNPKVIFVLLLVLVLCKISSGEQQISQYGITWTFDKDYVVGRFVNGDYWVLGDPNVTIVSIDPHSVELDGRIVNGSMLNPDSSTTYMAAYDSNLYRKSGNYIPELNVARPNGRELSETNPLVVEPNSSLVSVISRIPQPPIRLGSDKADLTDAAVLTILNTEPPEGSFRPPYAGADKKIRFNINQLDYSYFGNLQPVAGVPILHKDVLTNPNNQAETVERMFERVWIDTWGGEGESYMSALHNQALYGRDISTQVGLGALMLNLNYTNAEKETLLIHMVQRGIDSYGIVTSPNGNRAWSGRGGHNSGRFFLILLAGIVLDDNEMRTIGTQTIPNGGQDCYGFGEIDQTFYVSCTDENSSVINYGIGGYNENDIGLPEWSLRHWSEPANTHSADQKSWTGKSASYRVCCTAKSWAGFILASHIMGIKELWCHDAVFDYQDRWMQLENSQTSDFVLRMWNAYRAEYGPVWTMSPQLIITAKNGSVTKNPDQVSYVLGRPVILNVAPEPGYVFTGWSGDLEGSNYPATVVMNANLSITANFSKK